MRLWRVEEPFLTIILLYNLQLSKRTEGSPPQVERLLEKFQSNGISEQIPPVKNGSYPLVVKLLFAIRYLHEMDIKSQVMTSSFFLKMTWKSDYHVWDPDNYEGLKEIQLPVHLLWTPSIALFNKVQSLDRSLDNYGSKVVVDYQGSMTWTRAYTVETLCEFEVRYFPFDTQSCHYHMGFWYDSVSTVSFDDDSSITTVAYQASHEWLLVSYGLQIQSGKEAESDEHFSDILFEFKFARMTFFYVYTLIIPSTLLSFLIIVQVWLPAPSGEKITFGLGVLLSTGFLALIIAEDMFSNADGIPLLVWYLITIMIMTSLFIGSAVLSVFLYHESMYDYPLTRFWFAVDNFAAKYLRCSRRKRVKFAFHNKSQSNTRRDSRRKSSIQSNRSKHHRRSSVKSKVHFSPSVKKKIRARAASVLEESDRHIMEKHWKEISASLDRISYLCYSVVMVPVTITFLLVIPCYSLIITHYEVEAFMKNGEHRGKNITILANQHENGMV